MQHLIQTAISAVHVGPCRCASWWQVCLRDIPWPPLHEVHMVQSAAISVSIFLSQSLSVSLSLNAIYSHSSAMDIHSHHNVLVLFFLSSSVKRYSPGRW